MAKKYTRPGVFIEEIPTSPLSVAQVETAIPVFIGYTARGGIEGTPLPTDTIDSVNVTEAKRITSLLDYETYFGKGIDETITIDIKEYYTNVSPATPELKKRVVSASVPNPSIHTMYYHMQLYFANGGGPCYVISVGDMEAATVDKNNLIAGLKMAERYDEPTLLVFPQATSISGAAEAYDVYDSALMQAGTLKDRFVIMDCHGDDPDTLRDGTNGIGTTNLKYGAAYHPFLRTSINYQYDVMDTTKVTITVKKNLNEDGDFEDTAENEADKNYRDLTTELQSLVDIELGKLRVTLSPCAAVVGVYALVDRTRGVWKAPANVSLNLVSGLTKRVTDETQGDLNVDEAAGKSINVIRAFAGKGIMVWGARTLAGNDNEWRYVSVRRFFNMVEESCKKASEGFVFEPNDSNTWVRVQGMLENFLTTLWRQSALQGAKPEHAFYVAVGLNKTMTALDILEGRMIVEIGLAVVRPAEFIILRFSHKMGKS